MIDAIKNTWFSKTTIVLTIIQLLLPFFWDEKTFNHNLIFSIPILIFSTYMVNWNVQSKKKLKKYKDMEPVEFQTFKFLNGIIVIFALVIVNLFKKIYFFDLLKLSVTLVFAPFLCTIWASIVYEIGFYDMDFLGKIKMTPKAIKNLMLYILDFKENGKINIINIIKSIMYIISFIVLVLMIVYFLFH